MQKDLRHLTIDFIKKFKLEIAIFYIGTLVCEIFSMFCGGYYSKVIIDNIKDGNFHNIELYCILFCFAITIQFLRKIITKYIKNKTFQKINIEYLLKYFSEVLNYDIDFFVNNFSGQITTKLNNIQKQLEYLFIWPSETVKACVLFFVGIIVFYFITPKVSIFCIIWFVVYITFLSILLKLRFKITEQGCEKKSRSLSIINDCFTNILNIKIFSSQRKEYKNIKKQSINILQNEWYTTKIEIVRDIYCYLMVSIFAFGVFSIAFNEYFHNRTSIGTLIFISEYCFGLTTRITWGFNIFFNLSRHISSLNNSIKAFLYTSKINDKQDAKKLEVSDGKIELKNIRFNYEK